MGETCSLVLIFAGVSCGVGLAAPNPDPLRCGDSLVGEAAYLHVVGCVRLRSVAKGRRLMATSRRFAPCARCVVQGLGQMQLSPRYNSVLKANEALRRLQAEKERRRGDDNQSATAAINPKHLALLSKRGDVKPIASRGPAASVPDIFNWLAGGFMILLGFWGMVQVGRRTPK